MRGLLDAGKVKGLLSMKARLFPRRLVGVITAFFLLPFSSVYADGLTQDSEYWKWWYIENTTDAITEGNGASADNLTDTYNGSTVGQYVYDQTGLTADDVKEYVQQQYDNATGYVEHNAEWYSSAIDDIWNSSIDVGTKAKYQAEKALRETVDTAGNTVVNVSSSDYWSNVYNDLFNSGAYNDQYTQNPDGGYNVNVNGVTYNISLAGIGDCTGILVNTDTYTNVYQSYNQSALNSNNAYTGYPIFSVNGGYIGNASTSRLGNVYYYTLDNCTYSGNVIYIYWTAYRTASRVETGISYLNCVNGSNISDIEQGSTSVLQPKQIGFVTHNGIKYPVYSDPSLNPFKINDNGTVTWLDGSGDEPIYVDPTQLTDDGSLDILSWIDQDDLTQNPYNPFGKPWNTQDDGSILGGFFDNLVKDIGSVFNGLADKLSNLFSGLIDGILNALSSLFDINYNSITTVQLDVNFNIINTVWQKLLEILGVT